MGWTDTYPVFDHDKVSSYKKLATPLEREEIEKWLEISRIINQRQAEHRVVVSLFWKHPVAENDELIVTSRDQMKNAAKRGIVCRFPPWEHYVEPLLKGAALLKKNHPEIVLRIYLAADLEFLIEDFLEFNCEIMLMESSSIRHNPGALWRFLALEAKGEWITIIDADRGGYILTDVKRSIETMDSGLGLWRVPYFFDFDDHENDPGYYRPINACQFGARGGIPIRILIESFIWHNKQGSMPSNWKSFGSEGETRKITSTHWPSYGFDEWFLLSVLYPRLAFEGVLTIFLWGHPLPSFCHIMDIEYVTWANPKSEVHHGSRPSKGNAPWDRIDFNSDIIVRVETDVISRERVRGGPFQRYHRRPVEIQVEKYPFFQGNLIKMLSWSINNINSRYWIDLDPRLKLGNQGGELFLDRRYSEVDVVVCGYHFVSVSYEIEDWAKRFGLKDLRWKRGSVLKVPKLDGPLIFWRTNFSGNFYKSLSELRVSLDPCVFLRAWIDTGKAKVLSTTCRQMGWDVR